MMTLPPLNDQTPSIELLEAARARGAEHQDGYEREDG
jgi:hypothetical protein